MAVLRNDCEVAVIGAGPYGLATAAHLKAANLSTRVFGEPMAFWRTHMPRGMKLLSPWAVSHIGDPEKRFTLDNFTHKLAIAQQKPFPLEQFVQYGEWFTRQTVPDLDTRKVLRVEDIGSRFCLVLEDGELVYANRVVIALGLANQEYRPPVFDGLPAALVSHTGDHVCLDQWRGKRIAVVGRGQGACESAVLMREAGAEVELICRGDIRWLDRTEGDTRRDHWRAALRRIATAPSHVGSFPLSFVNEMPGLLQRAPAAARALIALKSLRPAAAGWVKPRFEGIQVRTGRAIVGVRSQRSRIAVQLDHGSYAYDHVLLATGYRPDVWKLGILSNELLRKAAPNRGSPALGAGFESAVPGLHFVGASAVASFGPLMRFIAGTGYAGRSVTRAVLARRASARPARAAKSGRARARISEVA